MAKKKPDNRSFYILVTFSVLMIAIYLLSLASLKRQSYAYQSHAMEIFGIQLPDLKLGGDNAAVPAVPSSQDGGGIGGLIGMIIDLIKGFFGGKRTTPATSPPATQVPANSAASSGNNTHSGMAPTKVPVKKQTPTPALNPTKPGDEKNSPGQQTGNIPPQEFHQAGKCHASVPAIDLLGKPASEVNLDSGVSSGCICENAPLVGKVCAETVCNVCPEGTCECGSIPTEMPTTAGKKLNCTNGGDMVIRRCN